MKKDLLDIIFASEKRKKVLLILHEETKEMPVILSILDTTPTGITAANENSEGK